MLIAKPKASDEVLGADQVAAARQPLARASTLPTDAFTSPAVYERESERIFRSHWLCAGRVDQIPEPGDYFSLDLLGERLVIVRDVDTAVRVLSRVCRHRAAEVISGAGNTRSFQCPYHAWTYRLDGQLVGAPYMDEAEGFDRNSCRLPEIRSERWEGWIFVNLEGDAAPLAPRLAPLSKRLAGYRMSELVAVETAIFDSPFNWKVLVDNFMEAYHHIAIHGDTLEPMLPAALSHVPDNDGPYSLLVMPGASNQLAVEDESTPPRVGPIDEDEAAGLLASVVFPFHLFAPSATSMAWYQLLPQSWDRFTLRIYTCFPRKTLDDPAFQPSVEGVQALTRAIHHQDIEACEAVWAGLRSGSFESGRLSALEKAIWQFNQWWIEQMLGAPPHSG